MEEAEQRRLNGVKPGQKCFFDLYLDLQGRKDSLQNLTQVFDGAFNLMTAGIHTTSYSLSWATFRILSSPSVLAKVRAELQPFNKENFDTDAIQSLPYLVCLAHQVAKHNSNQSNSVFLYQRAVIKETMRLADPVPGILPRAVPKDGVHVGPYFLPSGVGSLSLSYILIPMAYIILLLDKRIRHSSSCSHESDAFSRPSGLQPGTLAGSR